MTKRTIRRLAVSAVLAATALTAVPAAGHAATVKFGAKLGPNVQPSNAGSGHPCSDPEPTLACTRVMMDAYGRPNGGARAPRDGVITRLRLIANVPGQFRLQIARANPQNEVGRVLRAGPVIHYQGQSDPNADTYEVESFDVHVPVHQGERLAIRGNNTSLLRCSSGGANTLVYIPPLVAKGDSRPASDHDGCWLLLEAVVRYQ
jgi:hypothetical protein